MAAKELETTIAVLEMGHSRFAHGVTCVPDERLNWTPAEGAKTPLAIAATLAAYYFMLEFMVRMRRFPLPEERPPLTEGREEALQLLESRFRKLVQTLDGLTEADLEQELPAPWGGSVAMRRYVGFFPVVIGYWQGQLNYVQIAYGDNEPNIPVNWGLD